MRVSIYALGKQKASPEKELVSRYLKQTPWTISITEHEVKKNLSGDARKLAEAEWLLSSAESADKIIALDERGKTHSSESLAKQFGDWQQDAASHIAIVIGGADGLHQSVRDKADMTLSFGAMTWPHMMVRAMLCEQIYRIHTILTNHPYHRS
ncbi:MAG: 23S rRNA (pseudouridine(1915)-N(3))-methyltransferase RlmH [Rickettsiales bacterium]|nr:23S rRNA (pseudouridine(1915)-N(3))-methyltransferase RlmH [Rickettsiales bacterium]